MSKIPQRKVFAELSTEIQEIKESNQEMTTNKSEDIKVETTKSTVESKPSVKQETREDKKAKLRRILGNGGGPLHIDESKLDRQNKHYRIFNMTPGSMDKAAKRGYIPTKTGVQVGDQNMSGSVSDGSSVFNVSRSNETKGVLMEISIEQKELLDEIKRERADDALAEAKTHVNKNFVGDIKHTKK